LDTNTRISVKKDMNSNTSSVSYNGSHARHWILVFSWYPVLKSKFLRKLALVNLIGLSRCSIQSLAIEPLITFPIRLQIVPRWTWKPVLAGGSPLAVVKVSHPKGVEDRSGDLIYKGDHIYKDEAAVYIRMMRRYRR